MFWGSKLLISCLDVWGNFPIKNKCNDMLLEFPVRYVDPFIELSVLFSSRFDGLFSAPNVMGT